MVCNQGDTKTDILGMYRLLHLFEKDNQYIITKAKGHRPKGKVLRYFPKMGLIASLSHTWAKLNYTGKV